MTNSVKIKKALSAIYKKAPELKNNESELKKILSELVILEDEIIVDASLLQDLKAAMQNESKKIKKSSTVKKNVKKSAPQKTVAKKKTATNKKADKNYYSSASFVVDLSWSFVLVAVLLLLVTAFSFVRFDRAIRSIQSAKYKTDSVAESLTVKTTARGKNGFGSLFASSVITDKTRDSFNERALISGHDDISFPLDKDWQPLFINYNYRYQGNDFLTFDAEENVYKGVPANIANKNIFNLSTLKPLFDVSRLKNTNIAHFDLAEDRDFGYNIYFSLKEGEVSFYKNWDKWPSINSLCGSEDNKICWDRHRITWTHVLLDSELIKISDKFLQEYSIDIKQYGPAEVQKEWMKDYLLYQDLEDYYLPESITVVYPLVLEDNFVYNEFGKKTGLHLEVDLREKRVSGVYGLSFRDYEKSKYFINRNTEEIIKSALEGGISYNYNDYLSTDVEYYDIDIDLGSPILGLVQTWRYDEKQSRGEEFYIPAYIFPVVNSSDSSQTYFSNIIVPAVQDFFDDHQSNYLLWR